MGKIVQLNKGKQRRKPAEDLEAGRVRGKLLLFTGVRYERKPETPDGFDRRRRTS